MEQFLDADVPAGREPVADIPLPPFAAAADHRRYLDMLQLYLAMLDPGAPATNTVILTKLSPLSAGVRMPDPSARSH